MIDPSPGSDCHASWNWSDDAKMSAPDAVSVKAPPARLVPPATFGAPMSAHVQPVGQAPAWASVAACFVLVAASPGTAPALQETRAATTTTAVAMPRGRWKAGRRPAGPGTAGATVRPVTFENIDVVSRSMAARQVREPRRRGPGATREQPVAGRFQDQTLGSRWAGANPHDVPRAARHTSGRRCAPVASGAVLCPSGAQDGPVRTARAADSRWPRAPRSPHRPVIATSKGRVHGSSEKGQLDP